MRSCEWWTHNNSKTKALAVCDLLLTVGALLGPSSEKQLGHGDIVGHDGDVQGKETFTVRGVEVKLFQTVLGQKQLNQVQLLVLHRLKQRFTTLELLWKDKADKVMGDNFSQTFMLTTALDHSWIPTAALSKDGFLKNNLIFEHDFIVTIKTTEEFKIWFMTVNIWGTDPVQVASLLMFFSLFDLLW